MCTYMYTRLRTCDTFPAPVNVNMSGPKDSGSIPYCISRPRLAMAALAPLLEA